MGQKADHREGSRGNAAEEVRQTRWSRGGGRKEGGGGQPIKIIKPLTEVREKINH